MIRKFFRVCWNVIQREKNYYRRRGRFLHWQDMEGTKCCDYFKVILKLILIFPSLYIVVAICLLIG